MEKLVGVEELAEFLGVDKSWVYEKSRLGLLKVVKVGKYNRYNKQEVLDALKEKGDL